MQEFHTNFTKNTSSDSAIERCDLSDEECALLITIKRGLISSALVVDVITLFFIILLRKYKHFNQRLVIHMLLSELLHGAIILINDGHETYSCILQAFANQSLGLTVFLWTFSFSLYLFLQLVKEWKTDDREWIYNVVCWCLPLPISCLPLITGDYTSAGVYCWISNTSTGIIWRFSIFWAPLLIGVCVIVIFFVTMWVIACRAIKTYHGAYDPHRHQQKKLAEEFLRPLTMIAVVFACMNFFRFLNRVLDAAGKPRFALYVLHLVCFSSYSFAIVIMFLIINGRQEFTLKNFKDAIKDYKMAIYGEKPLVEEIEVESTTTSETSSRQQ